MSQGAVSNSSPSTSISVGAPVVPEELSAERDKAPSIPVPQAEASPPPAPDARALRRLTAQVKTLGVPLADLLDERGELPPDKIETATRRIAGEAKRRLAKEPDAAARLYQHALKLAPKDLALRTELAKAKLAWSNREEAPPVRKQLIAEGREELRRVLQEDPRHPEALQTLALSLGLDPGWLRADGGIDGAKARSVREELLGTGPRSLEAVLRKVPFPNRSERASPERVKRFQRDLLEAACHGTDFSLLSPADQRAALRECFARRAVKAGKSEEEGTDEAALRENFFERGVKWEGAEAFIEGIESDLDALAERMSPARKLAQAAVTEGKDAELRGDSARAGALFAAAAQLDPDHAVARMKVALALHRAGHSAPAAEAMARAIRDAPGPSALDEIHAALAKPNNARLLGGQDPWAKIGDDLSAAGGAERHALAKLAYERAAEASSDKSRAAHYRRQAQLADEAARPYEKEFAGARAPNPVAQVLYRNLKAQGVPDAEMDQAQDRRLDAEEVFAYLGSRVEDPAVQAALRASGIELSKEALVTVRKRGFAAAMAERHAARAAQMKRSGGAGAAAARQSELEMALYFDPKNPARYHELADTLAAAGKFSPAVEILSAGLGVAPQDARLKEKLFAAHRRGLATGLEEAERLEAEGDLAGAQGILTGLGRQQEALRSLVARESPLDSILEPKQVESFEFLYAAGRAQSRLARILAKQGRAQEARVAWKSAASTLEGALRADPKNPEAVQVLRLRHQARDALGDVKGALEDIKAAADRVPFDVPGGLEPHREAMEYERGLRERLRAIGAERRGAETEADSAALDALTRQEADLREALGDAAEAQALRERLGEKGERIRLEGLRGAVAKDAAEGRLDAGAIAAAGSPGAGLRPVAEYVSLVAKDGKVELKTGEAFAKLAAPQQLQVMRALRRAAARSALLGKIDREGDATKKAFWEGGLAAFDGDAKAAHGHFRKFLAATRGASDPETRALQAEASGALHKLEAEARKENRRAVDELRALLGPAVPAVFRDAEGKLDLAKIPPGDFSRFKKWLLDQCAIEGRKLAHLAGEGARLILTGMGQEGAAQRASEGDAWRAAFGHFGQVLASGKYDRLLRVAYAEVDPAAAGAMGPFLPEGAKDDLRSLTRDLVTIGPNAFAASHLSSREGRARLRAILKDEAGYDKQTRVDLLRAVARIKGTETAHGLHAAEISKKTATADLILFDVNVSNLRVEDEDITEATRRGVALLDDMDDIESQAAARREKYLWNPERVRILPGHAEGMDGRKLVPEEIQKMAELVERGRESPDPLAQLRGKLAGLWLLCADQDEWQEGGALAAPRHRAHLLKGAERLMAELDQVRTPEQFRGLNRKLQDLLKRPLPAAGSAATRVLDDALQGAVGMSSGLAKTPQDMFEGISAGHREPFDALLKTSDEWEAAFEMGEPVSLKSPEPAAADPKTKAAVSRFIQGLETAKRGLWYGYKQKHWLYRGLSTEGGGLTDAVPDIRKANRALDGLIQRLRLAKTPRDLEAVQGDLFTAMQAGGALNRGFRAAAADWGSELAGLAATTLETAALAAVSGGAAAAGRVLRSLRGLRALEGAGGALATAGRLGKGGGAARAAVRGSGGTARAARETFDSPFTRAVLMGGYISLAENTGAKLSGQLKTEPDTILGWFKDAVATGLAMGLVAPLQPHAVRARDGLFRQMWSRYAADPRLGPLRLAADTVQEAVEEVLDAYVRQTLDGDYRAMSWEEFRDIVSVCAFGGVQMGMTKQLIGGGRVQGAARIEEGKSEPKISPPRGEGGRAEPKTPRPSRAPGPPGDEVPPSAPKRAKPELETRAPEPRSAEAASPAPDFFQAPKVASAEEIRERTPRLGEIADQVGKRSTADYLALPAARDLSPAQRRIAESAFATLVARTAGHFQDGKLKGLENPYFRRAALAQHVGYLGGELGRKFPSLDGARAKAILQQHFENPSGGTETLAAKLQAAAGGDAEIGRFVRDEGNAWMFGSFGDLDHALNLPGVYAGQALVKFATALAGDRKQGKALLQRLYDASPEALRRLMEKPEGKLGLLCHFAARAAQAAWLVSKLGQGCVEAAAGKDAKALSRWTGDLIAPFDEMAERKGWAEVVKDLDQARNYLQHRFGDRFDLPTDQRGTHFLTDLEGRRHALDKLVEAGKLRWVDGRLDFVHPKDPNEKLVFGGDLPDRGPDSVKLVQWLVDLKKRYPERVTLLWGNRDLNKLGLLRDLPDLESCREPGYRAWLEHKYPDDTAPETHNTLENRVEYWLESKGNKGALERHRKELEELAKRPVTAAEAARDFVDRVKPGGAFFEYLRWGQIIHLDRNVVYVHGGVTRENMGIVPGRTERLADAREWIEELNAWGRSELDKIAAAYGADGMGGHIPQTLLSYGDAIWDPEALRADGGKGAVFMNDQSVIYNFRQTEAGNFRAPGREVVDYFARAGIDTEINGHSPFGDVPGPIKSSGFIRVMADTSYGSQDAGSSLTVDSLGGVWVHGKTGRSGAVDYRVSARSAPPIGHVTEDGFTVIGSRRSGRGATEYLVAKYYNGFEIAEKVLTREQLEGLNPRPAGREETEETAKHRESLIQSLKARGKRLHEVDELSEDILGDRVPVVISGASKFGQYPASPEVLEAELSALLDGLDPEKVVLFTGGTDHGVEKVVHRLAIQRGFRLVGFIQAGAIPGEIDLVGDLVVAGERNQWADPLLASLHFAKAKGGMALFVGGGGVVKEGIEAAEQLGIDYYLMAKGEEIEGAGGASGEAALRFPDRSFRGAADLRGLVERGGRKVFREGAPKAANRDAEPGEELLAALSFGQELQGLAEGRPGLQDNPLRLLNAFLRGDLGREPTRREVEELAKEAQELLSVTDRARMVNDPEVGPAVFQIYTREFLDAMATYILKQAEAFRKAHGREPRVAEIVAGDGRLSRALNRRLGGFGLRIQPSDIKGENEWGIVFDESVETKDAVAAAREADILVASWIFCENTFDVELARVVEEDPTKTLIFIGEGSLGAAGSFDFWEFVRDREMREDFVAGLNYSVEDRPITQSRLSFTDIADRSQVQVIRSSRGGRVMKMTPAEVRDFAATEKAGTATRTLPGGEHWEIVREESDETGEIFRTARAKDFDPRSETKASLEGNLYEVFANLPELARRWGIRVNPDGTVRYPEREGVNRRLQAEGYGFRFWEPTDAETNSSGEAELLPYLEHLTRDPIEFPWSGNGPHHFHDIVAHSLGYAALPKNVRERLRAIAAAYRELSTHPDFQEPLLQGRVKRLAQDFVDHIDSMTALLTGSYLRLVDEKTREPGETREGIHSKIEAWLARLADQSVADVLEAIGRHLDTKQPQGKRALLRLRKMEARAMQEESREDWMSAAAAGTLLAQSLAQLGLAPGKPG